MVNKTFNIPLDLKLPSASEVEVVEGDSGNILVITLTDDGASVDLSGCKVLAVFSRSDGATVEQDTDDHGVSVGGVDNNVVTIDLYTDSFRPGTVACELQVYSGTNQATLTTSARFTFECRRSIMNPDTVLAEEKYPILVALIARVNALAATITSAIADAAQRVQANWTQTDTSKTDYVRNKPTAFTPAAHATAHALGGADAFLHALQHAHGAADAVTPASIGAATVSHQSVTLTVAGWTGAAAPFEQTVSVLGVTADNDVLVAPTPASMAAYGAVECCCDAQAADTLTFQCTSIPQEALSVNAIILT